MRTRSINQHQTILQINEDEVSKFYKERQLSKRQMINDTNTCKLQKTDSKGESEYKNLFRRKSLMNRVKEQSSLFTSFNNQSQFERPLANSVVKQNTRTRFEQPYDMQNYCKENMSKTFFDEQQENHSFNQSTQLSHTPNARESISNYPKMRSNSLQFEKSTPFERRDTITSINNFRPLRQTVPLSSILKKYQEEVNKLQSEQLHTNGQKEEAISKKAFFNEQNENNKQNYYTFQSSQKRKEQSLNLDSQESRKVYADNYKLPDVVEQCIDKWKKIQIQQLKAQRLYSKVKQTEVNEHIQTVVNIQLPVENSKILQEKQNQSEQKLKYEQKIKEQQEYIRTLQKQNTQFKKFVVSIQKMKTTLENIEGQQVKTDINHSKQYKNEPIVLLRKYQYTVDQNKNSKDTSPENEFNLKQLWRWIKSLPIKRTSQGKKLLKQSFR